jgi:Flp pilus assembly pilin Flp
MEGKRELNRSLGPFQWRKFLQDESGPPTAEYPVMLTIIMLCLLSIAGLGSVQAGVFNTAALGW